MLGSSPTSMSPGDLMMTPSGPSDELAALLGSLTSATSAGSPSEVKIDVGQ